LLSVLHKGKKGQTRFPKTFKEEPGENILFTLHNHSHGAIIPSGKDIYNITNPNAPFTGIVSEGNFGLIINKNEELSDDEKKNIEKDFENFHLYVDFCFERDKQKEIQKIRKSSKTKEDYNKEKQILFDKYLADHNSKFADEFNVRMEKYNIELIQIKV
jgi:hypothetical protein